MNHKGARIVKEANEYIVISSSCWTVNINYSAGDLIISLKGSMPLIGQFSKKWTYPSGYPQDKMIGGNGELYDLANGRISETK